MRNLEEPGRVLVSTSWTTPVAVIDAFQEFGPRVTVLPRSSDWGKERLARFVILVRSTFAAVGVSRGADALVMLTVGHEVFVAALLLGCLPKQVRPRLVVADFLMPSSRCLGMLQGWLLRRVDTWICIRQGDIASLVRLFGVDEARCRWAAFPMGATIDEYAAVAASVTPETGEAISDRGGYIYSAGSAHRDWTIVLDAFERVDCRAIIAVDPNHAEIRGRALPPNVTVLASVPPDEGRRLAAHANVVVVALHDTHLPAGPLVLCDALALGKAVVATDVNGTRDYVVDGCTGILVPSGDSDALVRALRRLLSDEDLRVRLGSAARVWAGDNLHQMDFARAVLEYQ